MSGWMREESAKSMITTTTRPTPHCAVHYPYDQGYPRARSLTFRVDSTRRLVALFAIPQEDFYTVQGFMGKGLPAFIFCSFFPLSAFSVFQLPALGNLIALLINVEVKLPNFFDCAVTVVIKTKQEP